MFKGKVSVEYALMQEAPTVWGSERRLGAAVVREVLKTIYPYMIRVQGCLSYAIR